MLTDAHRESARRQRGLAAHRDRLLVEGWHDPDMIASHLERAARALDGAALYWVTGDMASVAVHAADTLPEWTPSLAAPDPAGMLLWDGPVGESPWQSSPEDLLTVEACGVMWWHDAAHIRVQVLARSGPIRDRLADTWAASPLMPVSTLALPDLVTDDVRDVDGGGLAHTVGATWLLMRQRVATLDTVHGHPGGEAPRRGQPQRGPEEVRVVELRRPQPRRGDSDEPGTVDWQHRWIVSGHWRQQPVGPGRALREPRWIAPYVKGPEDRPLLEREEVRVWRR